MWAGCHTAWEAILIDPTSLVGIVAAFLFALLGFLLKHGHLASLFVPAALAVVFGCTLSSALATLTKSEVPRVFGCLRALSRGNAKSLSETIEEIVMLAEKARREGLLFLENYLDNVDDAFLRKGIQLVIDGAEPEVVRGVLETEIYAMEERHKVAHDFYESAGSYAPTMGIAGAIMGLIVALGSISDPETLGPAIAAAFVATLYGVVFANCFCFPVATKLKNQSQKEVMMRLLVVEGVSALQAGNNPIIIRERLNAFLRPSGRKAETDMFAESEGDSGETE